MSPSNKRVLLIQTGGTIAMNHALALNIPLPHLLAAAPELKGLAELESVTLFQLDSSELGPEHWAEIASLIRSRYESVDGFVVLHGTDTMAYTAAALSFFLQNLGKPVAVTGAQRPLSCLRSDARVNLVDAIELATTGTPGVMIVFDNKVHRGNRASKHSNAAMEAFRSYNAPLVGRFGVNLEFSASARKHLSSSKQFSLDLRIESRVQCLVVTPGSVLYPAQRAAILATQRGLLLSAFGTGNLPTSATAGWISLCKEANAAEIPVVISSQCRTGSVNLNAYEAGREFARAGALSAADLSFEAATVKLMVMLGRAIPRAQQASWFATPLAGECQTP